MFFFKLAFGVCVFLDIGDGQLTSHRTCCTHVYEDKNTVLKWVLITHVYFCDSIWHTMYVCIYNIWLCRGRQLPTRSFVRYMLNCSQLPAPSNVINNTYIRGKPLYFSNWDIITYTYVSLIPTINTDYSLSMFIPSKTL